MSDTLTIILSILAINIALFAAMTTLIIWSINKIDGDVKSIGTRLDGHAMRIDQLYRMFVDLLAKKS